MASRDVQQSIQEALKAFADTELGVAASHLWETLGYQSEKLLDIPTDPEDFFETLNTAGTFDRARFGVDDWKSVQFLFQLTNDEIPSLAYGQMSLIAGDGSYQKGMVESFVFLAIELTDREWTRTQLAGMTRELNRAFPMPVIVLFRYGGLLSIAVIDRRRNKRDASKDVIDRTLISIIKDIRTGTPHRAHLEILNDMALANVGERHTPSNFRDLYENWMRVLSVQTLNKRFYEELFTWYCWALQNTVFPKGQGKQNSVAVIRLLTRLIFVWFVKEKGVVPDGLFRPAVLSELLKESPATHPDSSSYYQAVLQNLFFATLNTEPGERKWKSGGKNGDGASGMTSQYLVHSVYRYRSQFRDADRAFGFFTSVPFLNGGLFECLDREVSARDLERTPALSSLVEKEGKQQVLRVDGFSDRSSVTLSVPNKLFFAPNGETVDLSEELHTKKGQRTARGLIDIFERYKFTIEENTPIEEEVALDPELLGKVFENLLASYNSDTELTARKQSGSFYTPREVVDYMVDESLIAYFEPYLLPVETAVLPVVEAAFDGSEEEGIKEGIEDTRLRSLLAFGSSGHEFSPEEVQRLIAAIEDLKTLDPACGSGAFPMGMLQKLVHVLTKLDPGNVFWKAQNRAPLERQLKDAESIKDPTLRETRIEEATDALEKLDRAFSDKHYADYSRKLFLIEKCLFGVDIQPIAVQIAKLRFFISLVVSQKVNPTAPAAADNFNITPLPNLETKLAAANSLIPIERPAQGSLRDTLIDDKEDELRVANERHFAARTTKTKRKWRDKITDLRDELADLLEQDSLLTKESAKQVVGWDPFDQNATAGFFDREWMFGLRSGFDIVLGNPPYVRQEAIKERKQEFAKLYECFTGTADLYVYFYERSIKLLKPGGTLAFITSNKWYRANYGTKLREWMNRNTLLRRIIDFGDEAIFTALAYPTIVVATRRSQPVKTPHKKDITLALNWQSTMPIETFPEVFAEHAFAVPQTELKSSGWQLEGTSRRDLLARVLAIGKPLSEWAGGRFYRGITTGLNEAFVIDDVKCRALIVQDPKSAEVIKPFLRGRDIKRWRTEQSNQWLIYIPWHFPLNIENSEIGVSVEAEKIFRKNYPAVYQHLETFKSLLSSRNVSETGIRYEWYALQRWGADYWQEFDQPKIVFPDIALSPQFAFDDDKHYLGNTGYIIPSVQPWLLAVLNSSLTAWFYAQISPQIMNGYFRFISQYVSLIRIPDVTASQQQILEGIVATIRNSPKGSSPYWEQLINGLVYELFFPEELHAASIKLFDAANKADLWVLADFEGNHLASEAAIFAETIFKNDHPIYRMLFDLQALPTVRIIEGKE